MPWLNYGVLIYVAFIVTVSLAFQTVVKTFNNILFICYCSSFTIVALPGHLQILCDRCSIWTSSVLQGKLNLSCACYNKNENNLFIIYLLLKTKTLIKSDLSGN